MRKGINAVMVFMVFVVSWATGVQYAPTPCVGKEPEGVICAKPEYQRTERKFKSQDAAEAFFAVMQEMKASDCKLEKRAK